jgi:hypothetical protein
MFLHTHTKTGLLATTNPKSLEDLNLEAELGSTIFGTLEADYQAADGEIVIKFRDLPFSGRYNSVLRNIDVDEVVRRRIQSERTKLDMAAKEMDDNVVAVKVDGRAVVERAEMENGGSVVSYLSARSTTSIASPAVLRRSMEREHWVCFHIRRVCIVPLDCSHDRFNVEILGHL